MTTTTKSEAGAAQVAGKKHTRKKIGSDLYEYRGYHIRRYDNSALGDPECRGIQWNIHSPEDVGIYNTQLDITHTLSEATEVINRDILRRSGK